MSDLVEKAEQAFGVVKAIMETAKESPELNEAGGELAKTALTLTKAINVALLPVAAVNFGYEKAREYYRTRFQDDLGKKMADVPPENIIEPKTSVIAPTLEGLSFSHDEESLREMYLGLLRSAMDSRRSPQAHPSFAQIIKQLSAEEAQILKSFLPFNAHVPCVQLQNKVEGGGYKIKYNHLINLRDGGTNSVMVVESMPQFVDNWVRLGIIEVSYLTHLVSAEAYSWVTERPEYRNVLDEVGDMGSLDVNNGHIRVTDFGRSFAAAVL